VNRQATFSTDEDRHTFLCLLQDYLPGTGVALLAWCWMTNHVHLIATPEREDSLAVLLRRVHGRYAQYYNVRTRRTGHLWQNRPFACMLWPTHLWKAIAYVERNPLRAGMVARAEDYRWSSARAHLTGHDPLELLDMEWWRRASPNNWVSYLAGDDGETIAALRACTYAGRPYGTEEFVNAMGRRFQRYWTMGRPTKDKLPSGNRPDNLDQYKLF
jgi:putative transposase